MKTIHEISEKTKQFEKLIELFDISSTGLWEMTQNGVITFYNENFYNNFDIPKQKSTLDDWINIVYEKDQSIFKKRIDQHTNSQMESFKSEYRVVNRQNEIVWIESQGIAQFNPAGQLISMVGSHSDITLKKQYNDKLYNMAYTDDLTGIFNRKKLVEVIENDQVNGISATLILLDFYQFKQLLSIYGHTFSNEVLVAGCHSIVELLDNLFTLFRISSSKFALLTHSELNMDQITKYIKTFKNKLHFLKDTFNLGTPVDFSSAILTYPLVQDDLNANDIINRTYLTLEEANRTQLGSTAIYSDETRLKVLKSLHIETNILNSLKLNEFYNVYQPIINPMSNVIVGFEALIRWNSEEWGTIFPDEFISVAEKNKTIVPLGDFVLNEACSFVSKYNQMHHTNVSISVNVSVNELLCPDFSTKILKTLDQNNLTAANVILEITESIMIDQATFVTKHLSRLKSEGIGISLDDFGTGYASLNNMIHTPLTELKIDRSIMLELLNNPLIFKFIKSVVDLCHEHHIHIVAEGIESPELERYAIALNVNHLQGYMYSKPLSEEDALQLKGIDVTYTTELL